MEITNRELTKNAVEYLPLRVVLVPISMILLVMSFQLVILPVALLFLQALAAVDAFKTVLKNRLTVTLFFNFMLQLAGFVVAVTLLWFRKRSFPYAPIFTMQLDVGIAMRQLSLLQFVRFVGLFVLVLVLMAFGLSVEDVSGNPYLTFAEATRGGYLTIILLAIVVVIFGPLFEELVFRVLLVTEMERIHVHEGLIMFLSGLIFGLAHLQTNLLLAMETGSYTFMIVHFFNSTLTGIILAHVYLRTRSLLTIWFMHALFNFMGAATLLGISDFAIIFNVFLFFLGFYLVIRHYSFIPTFFKTIKVILVRVFRNAIELGVIVGSLIVQLVFEVFIPIIILLLIQDNSTARIVLTGFGIFSFVLFLLYAMLYARKKTMSPPRESL